MNLWTDDPAPLPVQLTTAAREFPHQMLPLVGHLPRGDRYLTNPAYAPDLAAIKGITPPRCLGMNFGQVRIDRGAG